jgi:hypothetical protein
MKHGQCIQFVKFSDEVFTSLTRSRPLILRKQIHGGHLPKVLFRHGAIYPERRSPNNPTYVGDLFTKASSQLAVRTGFKQALFRHGAIYPERRSPNNPTCVGDLFTKASSQLAARAGFKQALFRRRRHRSGATESEQPYIGRGYVYLGLFINWLKRMGSTGSCFDVAP